MEHWRNFGGDSGCRMLMISQESSDCYGAFIILSVTAVDKHIVSIEQLIILECGWEWCGGCYRDDCDLKVAKGRAG